MSRGWTGDAARDLLAEDDRLPVALDQDEQREAFRALKGSMLRQEVYADDAGPGATAEQVSCRQPYAVIDQGFAVRVVQRRGEGRHGVFFAHPRETLAHHYERNAADPRTQQALTLEVDDLGHVLKRADAALGRRQQVRVTDDHGVGRLRPNPGLAALDPDDQVVQTRTLLTYTENRLTNMCRDPIKIVVQNCVRSSPSS